MADESEMKMEALKKAYAEIILNTSKEAAARVMAAERKALGFHHDLVSLKEESLRMFLRLKENFNSKITEAETRSVDQQLKIEELEAQLSEAEGIIVDLREELRQVQEKLDVIRHSQKQPWSGHVLRAEEPVLEHVLLDNALISSPLVMPPLSNGKSLSGCEAKVASLFPTEQKDMNSCSFASKSHLDQFHAGNCDFASIIMENRETELYRNGCTQRVRAVDRNLSILDFPSPSENHQAVINVQSETQKEQAVSSSHFQATDGAHNTSPTLFIEGIDTGHRDQLANLITGQNGEKKRGNSCDELNADCLKMHKTSDKASGDVAFSEARLNTVNDNVPSGKKSFSMCATEIDKKNGERILNSEGQLLHNCRRGKDEATSSSRRSTRKNSRYREAIAALRRSPRKNCIKSYQQTLATQDRTPPSNVNLQSANSLEIAEKGSEDSDICSTSLSEELGTTIEIRISCGDVGTGKEAPGCCEESDDAKSRKGFCQKLYHICDPMLEDAQLFDVPVSEGFGNSQCRSQGQAGNDRPLKFTFQRRRRKNLLGKLDDSTVLHRSTAENGVDKPTDFPGLEKHILKELNADDGGVMQVAHQLVSLPENRS